MPPFLFCPKNANDVFTQFLKKDLINELRLDNPPLAMRADL